MRLPRLVLSILIGAGVAVSGVILQGISRNDLASPDTVGVNAGSGLGMMFLLVLFPTAAAQSPLAAAAGGDGRGPGHHGPGLRAGLSARNACCPPGCCWSASPSGSRRHAAMLLFSLRMSFTMYNYVLTWMSGTLAGGDWTSILFLLPCCLRLDPAGVEPGAGARRSLAGRGLAAGLGVAVERQRSAADRARRCLTGACVAIGGHIGFLGLAAPHLARRLVGPATTPCCFPRRR